MRHLTLSILLAGGLLTGPLVTPASAVTVEELFSLKSNGLSDEILVALIESDGSVFQLLAEDVVVLARRGLSEKVLLAMIATSRRVPQRQSDPVVTATPTQQTVIQPVQFINASPVDVYAPVAVPVSVFVPVNTQRVHPYGLERLVSPSNTYWGFGGQLRPGSWEPLREVVKDRRAPDRDRQPDNRDPSPPARRR
jgi:hypothetical protein